MSQGDRDDGGEGNGLLRDGDPRHVGSYRLLRRLGEGGMGVVYLGRAKNAVPPLER